MVILKLTVPFFLILCLSMLQKTSFASKKSFVVYLCGHSHGAQPSSIDLHGVIDSHYGFLGSFLGSKEKAIDAIFFIHIKWHINGFSAHLEDEKAKEISKHPDVISVFLDKGKKLHTTRSWGFLGLERNHRIPSKSIWRKAKLGEDIIIGNIDTDHTCKNNLLSGSLLITDWIVICCLAQEKTGRIKCKCCSVEINRSKCPKFNAKTAPREGLSLESAIVLISYS